MLPPAARRKVYNLTVYSVLLMLLVVLLYVAKFPVSHVIQD